MITLFELYYLSVALVFGFYTGFILGKDRKSWGEFWWAVLFGLLAPLVIFLVATRPWWNEEAGDGKS